MNETVPNKIEREGLLRAASQVDPNLAIFIREIMPAEKQFRKGIRALKREKPELFKKLWDCIQGVEQAKSKLPSSDKRQDKRKFWEVVQELHKVYSCDTGFTDKGVRRAVTVYIKGERPRTKWPKDLIALQNKLVSGVNSKRDWTFSFDSRMFTAKLNQGEIDVLRKNKDIYRVIEEPEAHILGWGDYAPSPAFVPEAENVDWGTSRINPTYAWTKGIKGQGVSVGVIDTGIDYNHVDLVDRYKGGWNFITGTDIPMDDHMHGTHCCGIVGASDNGVGYKGVAPLVDLYAIKVLNAKGMGSLSTVAAGVDWCVTAGLDILSMSLGAPGAACDGALAESINNAWNQGLVVVVAAGNEGVECPGGSCVCSPGNCSAAIAVASYDIDEYRSLYSSYGPEVEIAAPGEGITAAWLVDHDVYDDGGLHIVGDYWFSASGTSMACPQVAGGCALIKCWYPDATNYQIREWLRDNARDL